LQTSFQQQQTFEENLFTLMGLFTGYCHLPGRLLLPLGADCVLEKQWIIAKPM